ncbi:unnamed protein product [Didymodactylos carnosus]|uniref:Uncharacterized protein n=1 Tax=Didymodactylos carnosus TaxID=1234261 RepID=A0A815QTC2_9BILA|nr:unnamed protein product [Didymodactylos carnosus]CAF4336192.1 unnamed protein product [Didymodactylos carnosus]
MSTPSNATVGTTKNDSNTGGPAGQKNLGQDGAGQQHHAGGTSGNVDQHKHDDKCGGNCNKGSDKHDSKHGFTCE